jgi:DNA-binding transcriptional LysR family regulator
MIERIHLAIVQEVEKQGSLTAAADVLCVTQSALSHSMRKLEGQLGTDVWLREGRSLRLTQAGQYLLAVANRVLPQLDLAESRLQQFAQGERGSCASAWNATLLPVAAENRLTLSGRLARCGCGREAEVPVWRHRCAVRL